MTSNGSSVAAGYFPRGRSMLRRVHSERAVGLLYGQRGLAIGALNPRAFVGTWEHTHAQLKPLRGSRPIVPRPVRRGSNTDAFALVAKTERRRLAAVPG